MRPPGLQSKPEARAGLRRQRGSVILFVLGLILLTALVLSRFIGRANTELLVAARQNQTATLRAEAGSALQVSLAVLQDFSAVDQGLHAPGQGWGRPLAWADYTPPKGLAVQVRMEDETGKLSLPTADAAALRALLAQSGCSPFAADRVADAMLAWTKPDYVAQFADGGAFRQMEPPITPPHRPLKSLAELKLIPEVRRALCDEAGDWNAIGRRFLQNASLFSFPQINLNTARPDVLQALGIDVPGAAERSRTADGETEAAAPIFASMADAAAAFGPLPATAQFGVNATCIRIVIVARRGDRQFQLVAVVRPGASSAPDASAAAPNDPPVAPRSWTGKNIDSGFQILEIDENAGS